MNFLSSIHNVRVQAVATSNWSALSSALNALVYTSMVDVSGNVYVGHANSLGTYKFAAVWNISTLAWDVFAQGFTIDNGGGVRCYAQDASRSRIYFGGNFTTINSAPFNRVAIWNYSTKQILTMSTGLNGDCMALAYDPSRNFVYVGGNFTSAGGTGNRNRIIRWNANNSSWETMGTGLNGRCSAIALDSSGNVYVGGGFSTAGGVSANYIAFRNITTNTWSALGSGVDNSYVTTIVFDSINNALYVGGPFTMVGGISGTSAIAKWDITTSTWSALGSGIVGTNDIVYSMALSSTGKLYVGGSFTSAGGVSVTNMAVWNTTTSTWSAMGTGISGGGPTVYSVSIDNTRKIVYAGGQFTTAGGVSVTGTARWSGGDI